MPRALKTIIIILSAGLVAFGAFWYVKNHNNASAFIVNIPAVYADSLDLSARGADLSIRPLNTESSFLEKNNEKLIYREAYARTDVEQTVFTDKIKEDIILKQAGHPAEFRYELNLNDFDYEVDEQGNIFFYTNGHGSRINGESELNELDRVFMIPAPYLIDANGEKSSTDDVAIKIENNILTITPSPEWLGAHAYPITLDPTVELVILNIHSHPLEGDDWIVEFVTAGQSDLRIIPNDADTVADDEFISLWCGDEQKFPEMRAEDEIFFANWECTKTGKVIHNTLKAGNYTLRFEFGGQISYAFNEYLADHYYAWAENVGWLNASSTNEKVSVSINGLTGYMWGENIGWINLDYDGAAGATNTTATDWGVVNDGTGKLSGYAWGENIGWLNFHPAQAQVEIDQTTGRFTGYAWGENIGWVNFGHSQTGYVLEYTGAPFVKTKPADSIGSTEVTGRAYAGGMGNVITERGFKYGTTTADTWTVSESGNFNAGDYAVAIKNLTAGTTYYVRAYAVNSAGTSYGEYVQFITEAEFTTTPIIFKSGVILKEKTIMK